MVAQQLQKQKKGQVEWLSWYSLKTSSNNIALIAHKLQNYKILSLLKNVVHCERILKKENRNVDLFNKLIKTISDIYRNSSGTICYLMYKINKAVQEKRLSRNYGWALYFIAIKNIVNLWTVHYTLVTINLMLRAYKSLAYFCKRNLGIQKYSNMNSFPSNEF